MLGISSLTLNRNQFIICCLLLSYPVCGVCSYTRISIIYSERQRQEIFRKDVMWLIEDGINVQKKK